MRTVPGNVLERVAGQFVSFFMIARSLFAVLETIWAAATERPEQASALDDRLRRELRVAAGLTLVTSHNAFRREHDTLLCSDSSGGGYALHRAEVGSLVTRDLAQWKERWRFLPRRDDDAADGCPHATDSRGGPTGPRG